MTKNIFRNNDAFCIILIFFNIWFYNFPFSIRIMKKKLLFDVNIYRLPRYYTTFVRC